jgi:hypothetical protein
MTQQSNPSTAARIAPPPVDRRLAADDDMAARLRAAGRRGATPALIGEALAAYWRLVAVTSVERRAAMLRALRDDIAAGHTTVRACVPVALGEPEFQVARDATLAYVGGWPTSVDRRTQVIDEVVDWIVRGLALDRAALFCALLERADTACLERLTAVRARLDERETAVVLAACEGRGVDAEVATFLAEWRSTSRGPGSVAA